MATEEIQISQLELADEVLADMVLPVDTATDTKAVTLKQLKAWLGSSLPTGFIIPAVGKISDERFTLLDGKTLSRAGTYQAFCNKVIEQVQAGNWFACSEEEYNADVSTFGQCGRFVIANDYVRIPKITRFIGATITLSEIGKTYAESLPNITGSFTNEHNAEVGSGGAIYKTSSDRRSGRNGNDNYNDWLYFDASRSSSTYKDGAKVNPEHTKYPYYMVVSSDGQTEEVGVDINKVYEDLNIKANSDLSNVDANIDYVVESYNDGTNWYRIYKSGWIEQGGYSTNGFITFLKPFTDANYSFLYRWQTTNSSGTAFASSYAEKTKTSASMKNGGFAGDWQAIGQGA